MLKLLLRRILFIWKEKKMKSAILSIGTEILFGQITNTNSQYLSQQMNLLGIDVMYHYTVGDNAERLEDIISMAFKDCDLIITTGGLGPTQDDLTKETVARALNDTLELHQPSMDRLTELFAARGSVMTENNIKQAYMPTRAHVLKNSLGTAPGFALEHEGKHIICLPGPPHEMKTMFEKEAVPYIEKLSQSVLYYKQLRLFGIGESQLETELLPIINKQTDPTIATYAKPGQCALRIASKRDSLEEAKAAVEEMIEEVKEYVGEYIFSEEDEELADMVAKKLLDRNITVASAESCTGGMFAARMTDISGISEIYDRGIVTYSNQAKMDEVGVKAETLEKYGPVSEETAIEMAEGLARVSGCDLCISVTGFTGPGGGAPGKPVGTVYMGAVYEGKTYCVKAKERNVNRAYNRNFILLSMFDFINKLIG